MTPLTITLYGFPGSNASATGELLCKHSGLQYTWKHLVPGVHALALPLRGFPGRTVPALRIARSGQVERIVGSRNIAARLHELAPDAKLFPREPHAHTAVEQAEVLGEKFANALRRIMYIYARTDLAPVQALVDGTSLGKLPRPIRKLVPPVLTRAAAVGHGAKPERLNGDLERIRATLTEVDELIVAGTLGGASPNAADLQFAPNLSALLNAPGLPAELTDRPWAQIAKRWYPNYPLAREIRMKPEWVAKIVGD